MTLDVLDMIEDSRLELQKQLDAKKSKVERNKLGQYATPTPLAALMLERAKQLMLPETPIRFLDPALGTGAFYSALMRVFASNHIETARGYEIDQQYGNGAKMLWRKHLLEIIVDDFTATHPPEEEANRYNLIICNPPYVRHHHLLIEDKKRLQSLVQEYCQLRPSGLSGLYVYFMCLAHKWLRQGGIAGWLVPSEFMDVNYGKIIREYLTSKVTLIEIHRFEPQEVQFDDALVSSAVVWIRNERPAPLHRVLFSQGGSLKQPHYRQAVSLVDLKAERKWSRFPKNSTRAVDQDAIRLADLFDIRRGVATGANHFFIIDSSHQLLGALPSTFLTPILPSPRHLESDEIQSDASGLPQIRQKLFLLNCGLPEVQVQAHYPNLWKYLQEGKAQGIHERYLCRQRFIWYSQDKREPSPFLCTYMGRQPNSNTRSPFRFILNHSQAIAPNVYLNIYPKMPLIHLLKERPDLKITIWQALQTIPTGKLIDEGRVYGGGLYKLEPKELGNLLINDIFGENHEILAAFPFQKRLF